MGIEIKSAAYLQYIFSTLSLNMAGAESGAVQVLKRAVELDQEKKLAEALTCYEQGIRLLLQVAKETPDERKRTHFQKKSEEYLARAEVMKNAATKQRLQGHTHKQIQIEAGDTNYSYSTIFGPLIDGTLTKVEVGDPYIRAGHQIHNFLRLSELLVRKASSLRSITLYTSQDSNQESAKSQENHLKELQHSLQKRNIALQLNFSDTLHDREIRFDNGWVIKIGRGLDYFQNIGRFSIGFSDFDLRPCHKTTIDIFHQQSM